MTYFNDIAAKVNALKGAFRLRFSRRYAEQLAAAAKADYLSSIYEKISSSQPSIVALAGANELAEFVYENPEAALQAYDGLSAALEGRLSKLYTFERKGRLDLFKVDRNTPTIKGMVEALGQIGYQLSPDDKEGKVDIFVKVMQTITKAQSNTLISDIAQQQFLRLHKIEVDESRKEALKSFGRVHKRYSPFNQKSEGSTKASSKAGFWQWLRESSHITYS